jgi:threonine dehydrogenase-like Zn-dependent dehydrogenase
MHAIALISDTTRIRMVDRPEAQIAEAHQIKVRVLRVGICGTDRDAAAGGRARAPDGRIDLVIGHELFGQVVAVGSDVTCVQPGDFAVFTVRRGCDQCVPCAMNRPDMCRTGAYHERGIWGLDGYQAEYVVDAEHYAVRVPPDLESIGVLTEPLAVAEKAIDEAMHLQSARLPGALLSSDWPSGRPCLVAGLGPIGLLVALVLRLRGAEVYGLDIVDPGTARPQWLAGIGGRYVDGRHIPPVKVKDVLGPMDLIVEATGVPALAFNLLDALAPNGVYVLTGIPGGERSLQIPGAELIRELVLNNQVLVGSVNAAREHFQRAVDDLARARLRWNDHVARLITHRYPASDFAAALAHHGADEIKAVLEWQNNDT